MASLQDLVDWSGVGGAMPESYGANAPIMDPLANLVASAGRAAIVPGQAYNSQTPISTDQMVGPANDLAALTTLGAGAAPAEANSLRMGIKAYHGSPHDFDAFDVSKIGTGEGAQAYGHGLYFAENPATAQAYKESLAPIARNLGNDQTVSGLLKANGNDIDGAIASANDRASKYRVSDPLYNEYKTAADKLQEMKTQNIAPAGRMYEVNINADPEHFLDWDKSVLDQHPQVIKSLEKIAGPNLSGIHAEQLTAPASDIVRGVFGSPQAASGAFRDAGIPGIKYLDQGSRSAGNGSHNYVVFDDKIVNVIKKYGMAGLSMLPPAMAAELSKQIKPVDHDPFNFTPVDHDPFEGAVKSPSGDWHKLNQT